MYVKILYYALPPYLELHIRKQLLFGFSLIQNRVILFKTPSGNCPTLKNRFSLGRGTGCCRDDIVLPVIVELRSANTVRGKKWATKDC